MTSASSFLTVAALALAVSTPALAQTDAPAAIASVAALDQVMVVGQGEARAAPDLAVTSLTVLRTDETARAALDEANRAATAVAAAMRDLGVESRDLQTGDLAVTPQYRYENRQDGTAVPPELVGYEVRNSLTVRVRDLDRLGEILDRAIDEGVNQGGDIRFLIEDASQLEDEARTNAFERARRSAETLARAAGRTLGPATLIADDVAADVPQPVRVDRMMAASSGAGVPIETGENTVTARVKVVFELGEVER